VRLGQNKYFCLQKTLAYSDLPDDVKKTKVCSHNIKRRYKFGDFLKTILHRQKRTNLPQTVRERKRSLKQWKLIIEWKVSRQRNK